MRSRVELSSRRPGDPSLRVWTTVLVVAFATACFATACSATASVATAKSGAAPDSIRYIIEEDGRNVGWFSVSRNVDTEGRTAYRGSGEHPGVYKYRRFEVVVGRDFAPASAFLRMSARGQNIELTSTFAKGKANTVVKVSGTKMPVPEERVSTPVFLMIDNVMTCAAVISDYLSKVDATSYKADLKVYMPGLPELTMGVAGQGTRAMQAGRERAEVRVFKATLRIPSLRPGMNPKTIELELFQFADGRFFGMAQPSSKIVSYPFPADAVIAEAPKPFPEIPVWFVSAGDTLVGSLMLPRPAGPDSTTVAASGGSTGPSTAPSTRSAALVLVAGSGPNDRDENVMGFAVFRTLAEKLAAAGYASLRYDKRGAGDSGGDYSQATVEHFAHDAAAAVAALRARSEIDPARVGILGHSEGAMLAPQIAKLCAQQGGAPWCAVLLAGSAATGREIILEQFEHGLAQAGLDSAAAQAKRTLQHQVFAYLEGKVDWEGVVALADSSDRKTLEMQKEMIGGAWFRSFIAYDPKPYFAQLAAIPVLILHGELDTQLPPHHGAAVRDALKAAGSRTVSYVPARGVNHLFQKATTGEVSEYATLAKEFAPGITDRIIQFLAMCEKMK